MLGLYVHAPFRLAHPRGVRHPAHLVALDILSFFQHFPFIFNNYSKIHIFAAFFIIF